MKNQTQKGKPVLTLPTEKSRPANDLAAYSILIYGREKAGKTTLAAEFPEVLFLSTEPGVKALSVYSVFVKNWDEFVKYIDLLIAQPGRYKNVCVDTVDLAFDMCEEWVCKKFAVNHASEGEWGQVWSAIRKEFAGQMARLAASNRGVILISHAKFREVKGRSKTHDQTVRDLVVPSMSNQARQVVEPMVDIWGYYEYNSDNERVLHIQGADDFSAGNRLRNRFIVPGSVPPVQHKTIPMGNSSQEAYANFVRAFNNEFKIGAVTGASAKRVLRRPS